VGRDDHFSDPKRQLMSAVAAGSLTCAGTPEDHACTCRPFYSPRHRKIRAFMLYISKLQYDSMAKDDRVDVGNEGLAWPMTGCSGVSRRAQTMCAARSRFRPRHICWVVILYTAPFHLSLILYINILYPSVFHHILYPYL